MGIIKIIFGANVFGWTLDEKQSFRMLDELYELGYRGIDTANMYSTWVPGNIGGESERIIGKWMKERKNREHMRIITKVGMQVQAKSGLKKDYILEAIDQSLANLQTDYVDVYLAHQEDTSTPIEESLGVVSMARAFLTSALRFLVNLLLIIMVLYFSS